MEYNYEDLEQCELCFKEFNLFRTKHKCKRCRLIICADCGRSKAIILVGNEKPTEPHRVCNPCQNDIGYQKDFEKAQTASWCHMTTLGKDWVDQALHAGIVDDFPQSLAASETLEAVQETMKVIKQEIDQGKFEKTRFNYSLLEFLHYSQQKAEKDLIKKHVENVLRAFHTKNKIVYCDALMMITVFLLSLCNERGAYMILNYIHNKILPAGFWVRSTRPLPHDGYMRERWIMKKYIDKKFEFPDDESKEEFYKVFYKFNDMLVGSLLVNSCLFQVLITNWTEMFKTKSIVPIENTAMKILHLQQEFVRTNRVWSLKNLIQYTCRTVTVKELEFFKNFTFSTKDRSLLEIEYDNTGKIDLRDRQLGFHKGHALLKAMTHEHLREYILEVDKVRSNQGRKENESVPLTKDLCMLLFPHLNHHQIENIFDGVDYCGLGHVSSNRMLYTINMLLSKEDIQDKIEDIFKLKDTAGRGTLDYNNMLTVFDWIGEVLSYCNEIDRSLLFGYQLAELREKLSKKIETAKSGSVKDLITIFTESPLKYLILDATRRNTLVNDYDFSMDNEPKIMDTKVIIQENGKDVEKEVFLEEGANLQESLVLIKEGRDGNTTADTDLQASINKKIKARKQEKKGEKDSNCKICNIF